MTTLVALATKDALIMGCDSLGTSTKALVDPFELASYFDSDSNFELRCDKDGKPLLKNFSDIMKKVQQVPYNHMEHVVKFFALKPFSMGVMITGIASLGNRTISSLIGEFIEDNMGFKGVKKPSNFTVKGVADRLLVHLRSYYDKEFPKEKYSAPPRLELILGGYNSTGPFPDIYRIHLPDHEVKSAGEGFGVVFGGQMTEIQRIVFGTDHENQILLEDRHRFLLTRFADTVKKGNKKVRLPDLDEFGKKYHIFGPLDPEKEEDKTNWSLEGFNAQWGNFSEQNAIDCVNWLIEIMASAQKFSTALPAVGGEIHIALITRDKLRYISEEVYRHEQHNVPRVT